MVDRKVLFKQLSLKFGLSIIILGALIFIAAGSAAFVNGWIFLLTLLVLMIIALVYFIKYDPDFLMKRLQLKEKQKEQKALIKAGWILFLGVFILPGLDYRFGWSHVPLGLVISAVILMVLGYLMFIEVMRENRFASRIIEVQENQQVIDTGLYGIIRHPMYLSSLIVYFSVPIVLGSYIALIPIVFYPVIIGIRIHHEEKLLLNELAGYKQYREKVKYRLIPFIW